jgi:hypothetical protein
MPLINSFADVQAVLALATDPTLVTLDDSDEEFLVVGVEVDLTASEPDTATQLELVPYETPAFADQAPIVRGLHLQAQFLVARASSSTRTTSLSNVTTLKKPPNGG